MVHHLNKIISDNNKAVEDARRRYWVSWVEDSEDYRPLTSPPNKAILGWWCTGTDGNGKAIICAFVEVFGGKEDVEKSIKIGWPCDSERQWRFCDQVSSSFVPNIVYHIG